MDEFWSFVSEYGEIASICPRFSRGLAFVTYYDLRDAQRAVAQAGGRSLAGRVVKASYAFRPPPHSDRDPAEFCSTVSVRSRASPSSVSLDEVSRAMAQFGEIRASRPGDRDGFIISFFNIRAASTAVSKQPITVKGESLCIELRPEGDVGQKAPSFRQSTRTEAGQSHAFMQPLLTSAPFSAAKREMQASPEPDKSENASVLDKLNRLMAAKET
jgi:RNA recognition motif-containing protein